MPAETDAASRITACHLRFLSHLLQVGVKTAVASASAAAFRIVLMPVDALKTTLQVGRFFARAFSSGASDINLTCCHPTLARRAACIVLYLAQQAVYGEALTDSSGTCIRWRARTGCRCCGTRCQRAVCRCCITARWPPRAPPSSATTPGAQARRAQAVVADMCTSPEAHTLVAACWLQSFDFFLATLHCFCTLVDCGHLHFAPSTLWRSPAGSSSTTS